MKDKIMINKVIRIIFQFLLFTFGCYTMAFSFTSFFIPNKIAPGGFSGLATVFFYLFGLPVGAGTVIMCIPLFIILFKNQGAKGLLKTIYGTIVSSFFIDYAGIGVLTTDIFLATIFGGIICGVGLGIVFKAGGSTGGTDTLALLLHEKISSISLGVWVLLIDTAVVVLAAILLKNIEIALYSAISIYVSTIVIDGIQNGINYARAFYIFTDNVEEMKDEIYKTLNRGVTVINAKGGYTNEEKGVILCIVERPEVAILKNLIKEVDNKAFVMLAEVNEVFGEGFEK